MGNVHLNISDNGGGLIYLFGGYKGFYSRGQMDGN